MSEAVHYGIEEMAASADEIDAKLDAGDELIMDIHGRPRAKVIPFPGWTEHQEQGVRADKSPGSERPVKRRFGLMKGMIVTADDWDSDETNEAIARDFYESEIFPE